MFFEVLVEEKPKPTIPEPTKIVPAKPEEAIAVPVEEPPKKGIDSLCFCCMYVSLLRSAILLRNT